MQPHTRVLDSKRVEGHVTEAMVQLPQSIPIALTLMFYENGMVTLQWVLTFSTNESLAVL